MPRRNLGCYSEAKSGVIQIIGFKKKRIGVFCLFVCASPALHRQACAYFPSFLCGVVNVGLIPWWDQPIQAWMICLIKVIFSFNQILEIKNLSHT